MKRPIFVETFCGFGGFAEGKKRAGRAGQLVSINHDHLAVGVHKANHPDAAHLCGDVFHVDVQRVLRGRRMLGLWASPDCTHFSRAKSGKPRSSKIRALADSLLPWLEFGRPPIFHLENVPEFQTWGPLDENNEPIPEREGEYFDRWLWQIRSFGYHTESFVLRACDFGAPTTRKRFFLTGRCDGERINAPRATHGPGLSEPHRSAGSIMDWDVPVPSIFDRPEPYSPATMRRIARALNKHVLGSSRPFLVPEHGYAAALIQTSYGERAGQAPRVLDITKPLGTVVAGGGKHALVCAFIVKHYGGNVGRGASLHEPLSTVTTVDHHALATAIAVPRGRDDHRARVQALIDSDEERAKYPAHLVIGGERYDIVDVGMRQLTPRERARAQGFGDDYILDRTADGEHVSDTAQGRMVGNCVPPAFVEHLLGANPVSDRMAA